MSMRHYANVFIACASMGFKSIFADKIVILGSYLVYAALMMLYAGVVRLIPAENIAPYGLMHEQMIWYLGTAEFIIFCGTEWWFKEVQNDIQSGQIHFSLLRPVSAALTRVSFFVGEGFAKALYMIPAYLVFMGVLTKGAWMEPAQYVGVFAALPLAVFMLVCGYFMVGVTSIWFVQADPVYWVWQKAIFLLGAMLWPMMFYPAWMQAIMWATPFPAILANAAAWAVPTDDATHLLGAAHQLVWAAAFIVLVRWFEKKMRRHIQERGA